MTIIIIIKTKHTINKTSAWKRMIKNVTKDEIKNEFICDCEITTLVS